MGRNLNEKDLITLSSKLSLPSFFNLLIKSINIMALFTITPERAIKPTIERKLRGYPWNRKTHITEVIPSGIVKRTING